MSSATPRGPTTWPPAAVGLPAVREKFGGAVTDNGANRARIKDLLTACIGAAAVDGGGMSLVSAAGMREPLYGSDGTAEEMERLQFTLGEGPCVDASSSGSPVLVPDLADPGSGVWTRWPAFLEGASRAQVRAIFAFPVHIGAISLGAIDLYRRSPGPLRRNGLALTLTTVDAIASTLLDVAGTLDAELGMQRLSGMAVHRAAGMVMEQLGTSIEEALIRLRATAYSEGLSIQELANDVVNGDRRFQEATE